MNERQGSQTSHRAIAAKLGRDQRDVRKLVESLLTDGKLSPSEAEARAVAPSSKGGRPGTEYMLSASAVTIVLANIRGPEALAMLRELAQKRVEPRVAPEPKLLPPGPAAVLFDKTHAAVMATGYPDRKSLAELEAYMFERYGARVKMYRGKGPFLTGAYLEDHGVAYHHKGPHIVIDDEEAFAKVWPPSEQEVGT